MGNPAAMADTAQLVVDMLNAYRHPDAEVLAGNVADRSAVQGSRPDLVKPIAPQKGNRVMTKVRRSVFYATPLDYLLTQLTVQRVILTGQVTEHCILYSALDAHVRHYSVVVPATRWRTSTPTR